MDDEGSVHATGARDRDELFPAHCDANQPIARIAKMREKDLDVACEQDCECDERCATAVSTGGKTELK